ncbi:hypothetical protein GCM10009641_30740 [Mycobacterium cookii]|uniref:Uncharacterized protein n=1 Tax=Nocardioides furvisabuli TaxID=375542 RepID=A0ABN2XJW8_9ACTN
MLLACSTRRGPAGAAASRSRTRIGAATPIATEVAAEIGLDITGQTLAARGTLANVTS